MTSFFKWVGSAVVVAASGVLFAQDDAKAEQDGADDAATAVEKTCKSKRASVVARSKVAKELVKLDIFNAEPNWKARYYIYLCSASWCGPCKREMPKIVEKYPEMKKKKVEVVLLGCDKTREAAEKYLKDFNAPFPGIMIDEGRDLPGFENPAGIPYTVIVTDRGKVIVSGFARMIMGDWEDYINKKKKANNDKKDKGKGKDKDKDKDKR